MDLTKFTYWMGGLLWDKEADGDIYRMKGLMAIEGNGHRMLYQGVATLFDSNEAAPWGPEETRICRLVFIGKGNVLDEATLRAGLRGCMVSAAAE